MKDIFDKLNERMGPLGMHADEAHGYFTFPKLEGPIAPRMKFRGVEKLTWSLNNYLGLANHPEVMKADAQAQREVSHRRHLHVLRPGAPQHAHVHHLNDDESAVRRALE